MTELNERMKERKEGERKEKDEKQKGWTKKRWKKREKRKQQESNKVRLSKCDRKITYLDVVHHRLQSVMINLFRLLLYHCFINILQLPATTSSYWYNSLSKALLRRGYVVPLLAETPIYPEFAFCFSPSIQVAVCFSACIFVFLVLNVLHHHLTQQPFVPGRRSWHVKNLSPVAVGQ